MTGGIPVKREIFRSAKIGIISMAILIFISAGPSLATELGEPLRILSHDYGFFSGDYYTWATCRAIGENIELFIENAIWDSSIVDTTYDIPSNKLTVLEADQQGGVYIGTAGGLAHFDGATFNNLADDLSDNIRGLSYEAGTGVLWITTSEGLYKYENDEFTLVFEENSALPLTAVKANSEEVWFGSAVGLYQWSIEDSLATPYPAVDTLDSPVSNVINDIELDAPGNVWVATDKGVNYYTDSWQLISSLDNLISDNVYDITLTAEGMWASTDKGLAYYVNDSTYSNYERKSSGLTVDAVRKVELHNAVRWIATGDGLFRFQGDYSWKRFGIDYTNYLEAHTTDTLNSLDIRDLVIVDEAIYLATCWGLTRYEITDGAWDTWRGYYEDEEFSADSALVAKVMDAWETKTPGLDSSHYFYNGIAQALGLDPGEDSLGIYDEVTTLFGDVSDVDNNGKVTVYLLDIRDYWDDSADALDGLGDLTYDGFFLTQNLFAVEPTMRRDLLYIDARRQSVDEVKMALANTLAKHIIYNHDPLEETWLREGLGLLAEIMVGYTDQSIGFRGFDDLNYPCNNSILSWQTGIPYQDKEFSELLLLYSAEENQSGDDGGIGFLLDIIGNSSEQGITAFNTALSNIGSNDTFSDLFFNLAVTAVIEQQKSTDLDHPEYNFSYRNISSITEYNTIYWGKNEQDSPPYLGSLPDWSSRLFNGRTMWNDALQEFRLATFNGSDNNHFRVALVMNKSTKPDTSTTVVEIPLDEYNESIFPFMKTLDDYGAKTFSVVYISDQGDGSGVPQMVFSQDVVSPDAFGGISIGVAQNPMEEKLLDLYVTSFEPLYCDVGDAAFSDDGGKVSVISAVDTVTVPMEKILDDVSNYTFTYEYTYPEDIFPDSSSQHTATASSYHLYHAEYTIPADGNYSIMVNGQDLSGNDAAPDDIDITVGTVNSGAKIVTHDNGDFAVRFGKESIQSAHTVVIAPAPVLKEIKSLDRSSSNSDFGYTSVENRNVPLSKAYKVGPQALLLNKAVTVRFTYDISMINPEDRPYVGVYRHVNGSWIGMPTRISSDGFIEAETEQLGIFQLQKGTEIVAQAALPKEFSLHQNYPNPFNPSTKIRFDLPKEANVTIQIYNVLGELVSEIVKGQHYAAGYHAVHWNGENRYGQAVASGLYYYSIKADHFNATKRMILVR